MSSIKEINLADGRVWGVGSNVLTIADVIVPITALDGMSDKEIGAAVRGLVVEAVIVTAEDVLNNLRRYGDETDDWYSGLLEWFEPWLDQGGSITKVYGWALNLYRHPEQRYTSYEAERPRPRPQEYVYLAHTEPGLFKIGRSRRPKERIEVLSRTCPNPVTLLHTIPAHPCSEAETALHQRFTAKQHWNEWFALNEKEVAAIMCLRAYKEGEWLTE